MANERITELPGVSNASLTDIIYAVQGYVSPSNPGLSVQETLQQVLSLMSSNIIQSFAGNPNGNVAGTAFNLLWDTVHKILWVCTTSGTSVTAQWEESQGFSLTDGQLLIGSTGNPPVPNTLTAGANITISNSPGSITISSTGGGGFMWTDVTGTTQTLVSNNGYKANSASLITFTLPATSILGDFIIVDGFNTGGWTIHQLASQQIILGIENTTVGTGGSVSSSQDSDSIALRCLVANTIWKAEYWVGNPTIV